MDGIDRRRVLSKVEAIGTRPGGEEQWEMNEEFRSGEREITGPGSAHVTRKQSPAAVQMFTALARFKTHNRTNNKLKTTY